MITPMEQDKLYNLVSELEKNKTLDELGHEFFKNYGYVDSISLQSVYNEFQIAKLLHEKACKKYPLKHEQILIKTGEGESVFTFKCSCGFSYTGALW